MVGKLAPNSSHLTRGLVKSVPGRGFFRAVPSENGDKYVTYPTPPQSLNLSIVELTSDQDHILSHAKTGEYSPEEGSINGVVRFGKVDKPYIQRNLVLPRQLLQPTNHKHHIGGRTVRSETALLLLQDPHALTVLAEGASDDLQQYLAGVRYQRDAHVVAAL